MSGIKCVGLLFAVLLLLTNQAFAHKVVPNTDDPNNLPPPGGAILDLAGQRILAGYHQYTVHYVATGPSTKFTWLFRNDPGFTNFDDMSVVDSTTGSGNLLTNPGFGSNGQPDHLGGWTSLNPYGAFFAGHVSGPGLAPCDSTYGAHSGSYFWCDGATQAYDGLDQVLHTVAGHVYTISFWTAQTSDRGEDSNDNYRQISTSDDGHNDDNDAVGNGDDILVYASPNGPPLPVPEPASLVLVGLGLVTVGLFQHRRS